MKARVDDVRTLSDSHADVVDRASALSRLTSDRRTDLLPTVTRLLDDAEPMLRSEALLTLVGRWWRDECVEAAIDRLHADPDPFVRWNAAAALGMYIRRTGRRRDELLQDLVTAVRDDPDPDARRGAYEELLRILAPDRDWQSLPVDFDAEQHVDWTLLAPYIAA